MSPSTEPIGCRHWPCLLLIQLLGFGSLFSGAADSPPQTHVATNRYEFRQPHDPTGIGKFYLGREIAHVMGHESADWLERPERDSEEHTEILVEQLKLRPGDTAADIGAGTGYFSRRLAGKVGTSGKVLAVDIQPEMLTLLTNRMAAAGIANVVPILGSATDPRLPAASVDLILMVDVYHEFDFPAEIMDALCRSLRPGGRVAFVEYRAEDPTVPIKPLHKMSEQQVKKEMSMLPLDWVETNEVLPRQHIIIFRKRKAETSEPSSSGVRSGGRDLAY
jgi:SAM-dependent methyltransferase